MIEISRRKLRSTQCSLVDCSIKHSTVMACLVTAAAVSSALVREKVTRLACKESRQSPLSLQPCWEGDRGDSTV